MLDAGMNVARLNFSHGDHESQYKKLVTLRAAMEQRPEKQCAVLVDTKGPEIRTGMLGNSQKIEVKAGQELIIVADPNFIGNENSIGCSYENLPQSVKEGSTIYIADGNLTCVVNSIKDN